MSNEIQISGWDKWQSYRKDRGQPPWIKVHRRIMRNVKWVSLTDSERGQLVAMWLLAADHDGVIPASPEMLAKLCYMTDVPNINRFIELGLLVSGGGHDDAKVTPTRRQHVTPEAETEADTEAEKKEVGAAQARPLPDDWQPRGEDISVGLNDCKYTLVEIEKLADGFRDHWRTNGKRKRNWDAAYRNWLKSSIATNDVAAWRKLSGKLSGNGQGAGGFIAALSAISHMEEQDIPGPDDYVLDGRVETDAGNNGGGNGAGSGTDGGVLGGRAGKGRGS